MKLHILFFMIFFCCSSILQAQENVDVNSNITFTYLSSASESPQYKRPWIGANFWANRLQDWQLNVGRLECIEGSVEFPLRTVHLLTHQLNNQKDSFSVSVRTGILGKIWDKNGDSFTGFLIGAGGGNLDYRAASLIHHFSGEGGGILAVLNENGALGFRSNNNSNEIDTYPELPLASTDGKNYSRNSYIVNWEDIQLKLKAIPLNEGQYLLTLASYNYMTGEKVAEVSTQIDSELLLGNIALVSHPGKTAPGRRYWFRDLEISGKKITHSPRRQFGPVLNTFYSRTGNTLKLSAQFPPLGFGDSNTCELQFNKEDTWETVQEVNIEAPSYLALFKLTNFKEDDVVEYRVKYLNNGQDYYYEGSIKPEPVDKRNVSIAGFTCYQVMGVPADNSWGTDFAGAAKSRWLPENIWFPHNKLMQHVVSQNPDLLVFLGDQVYEGGNPTNGANSEANPGLDYFYKFFIFLWDFNQLTKNYPSILLTDDHDVFQGDLWGDGGTPSNNGNNKSGGYVHEPEFVNMVERTQTAHNPDLFDPTPIKQDIGVYYGSFKFGGIGIAILEDRKFKSLPGLVGDVEFYGSKVVSDISNEALDVAGTKLLGERQLDFLDKWLADWEGIDMRLAVSQTIYASLHTTPKGDLWRDLDSGGWPQKGRNRALEKLRIGHSVIMGGDTHLPALVQHGIDQQTDAPYQLVVPAVSNKYRRWWFPKNKNAQGHYVDGLGNKVKVVAVGNPYISNQSVFDLNKKLGKNYGSEHIYLNQDSVQNGYGIIRFDKKEMAITFEAWDPDRDKQMVGWPKTINVAQNYMASMKYSLPTLISEIDKPVKITLLDRKSKNEIYTIKLPSGEINLKAPEAKLYDIKISSADKYELLEKVKASENLPKKKIEILKN